MNSRLALALLAALFSTAVPAREAAAIRIVQTSAAVAADPDHPAWDAAPASVVKLETAFPGHPSISGTALTQNAEVRALSTAAGLAIRLEWSDPVADDRKTQHRFADGAAIQFPRDGKPETTPYMGGAGRHVNIWYWNAAKNAAENLWADGFGTLTHMPTQDVKASGRHADGNWRVAFFRAWRSNEPRAAGLRGNRPAAFAIWNGANAERDGFKAVTLNWQRLQQAK
ncbi:MAG: ethylbenzene dehydrogenase-related protein [Sulfurisoma sp.]|nr:ethylbenzene dehydrogenase-related protein [Sulfurisoma sp.]